MGGGKAPSYPAPTAAEQGLQQKQADLVAQQTYLLQEQHRQQQMIAPTLYRQMGLIPQFDANMQISGFTEDPQFAQQQQLERQYGLQSLQGQLALQPLQQQALQQQLGMAPLQTDLMRQQLLQAQELGPLQTQLARQQIEQQQQFGPLQFQLAQQQLAQQKELGPLQMQSLREQLAMGRESFQFEKDMAMRQMGYTEQQIARQQQIDAEVRAGQAEQQRMEKLTAPFAYEQMGLKAQMDPTGKIIGFEKIVDPLQAQREAVEGEYLARTQKALRGELPVDPTVQRELATQEQTLRETLRRQLGAGYETSTPGIEALARFNQQKAEVLSGASRGELALSEQFGLARETAGRQQAQFERGGVDVGTALAGWAAQPRSELISLSGRGVGGGGAAAPSGASFANAAQLASRLGGGGGMPQLGPVQMPQMPNLGAMMGGMGGMAGLGGGGGGAFPSGQARIQGLAGIAGGSGANLNEIMQGIGAQQGTLGQWRQQQFQSQVAKYQGQQAETQMYAGLGGAALAAGAAAAVVSSRTVKRGVTRANEQRLRDELEGV